jgi:hypothetical protein
MTLACHCGHMALAASYLRTTQALAGFRRSLLKHGMGGVWLETRG